MARVSWVTTILKEAGWHISGLTHRTYQAIIGGKAATQVEAQNYTEQIMVNMEDGWREGTCEYPCFTYISTRKGGS